MHRHLFISTAITGKNQPVRKECYTEEESDNSFNEGKFNFLLLITMYSFEHGQLCSNKAEAKPRSS